MNMFICNVSFNKYVNFKILKNTFGRINELYCNCIVLLGYHLFTIYCKKRNLCNNLVLKANENRQNCRLKLRR